MLKNLEYIKENKNDFKICYNCAAINYYANEICNECNSYYFKDLGQYIEYNVDKIYEIKTAQIENKKPKLNEISIEV